LTCGKAGHIDKLGVLIKETIMKRKILMMSFAMIAGLPQAVCAKGRGEEGQAQFYSTWNTPYVPHYGAEGAAHPLMDHLAVPAGISRNVSSNNWKLGFAPPRTVATGSDNPSAGTDKRLGLSLGLAF
jgi:hypothetical protein